MGKVKAEWFKDRGYWKSTGIGSQKQQKAVGRSRPRRSVTARRRAHQERRGSWIKEGRPKEKGTKPEEEVGE